tara:strand:- start:191 stop:988 length:798 start_codon:yes stop_codon:yes gene_type:complete
MLKKILISLGVLVVLLGGGVFYLLSNLDEIVRTAIEDYGSEAVGSQVSVGAVEISLREGSASIFNFSIANPPGFSDEDMLRFAELSVALDLGNLSSENVGIVSIVSTDPFVSYERANGTTNIDVVSERLAGEAPQEPEDAGAESEMNLQIDDVRIRNIQASISDDRLRNPVQVSLGDITLQNLSGTPAEITQQILTPVMAQLARSASQAFLNLANELFTEGAEELRNRVDEGRQQLEDRVDETRQQLEDSVGEDIREGLGNLFGN